MRRQRKCRARLSGFKLSDTRSSWWQSSANGAAGGNDPSAIDGPRCVNPEVQRSHFMPARSARRGNRASSPAKSTCRRAKGAPRGVGAPPVRRAARRWRGGFARVTSQIVSRPLLLPVPKMKIMRVLWPTSETRPLRLARDMQKDICGSLLGSHRFDTSLKAPPSPAEALARKRPRQITDLPANRANSPKNRAVSELSRTTGPNARPGFFFGSRLNSPTSGR